MIDLIKLKEFQKNLEERARKELFDNLQKEVIQFLSSEFFKVNFTENKSRKQTDQSARVLNNWEKEGIIAKLNPDEGKSRRFNKVEGIWLEIVTTLRQFGLPLDTIKNVRTELFKTKIKRFSPFEYALMHSIMQEAIILMIFPDGKIQLVPEGLYGQRINGIPVAPHIHFNLLYLAGIEFPNNNFETLKKSSKEKGLTEKELQLYYLIRTGDYQTIKIRLSEGDILLLEGTRKIATNSRVIDILKSNKFQDIEIKTQDGQITHFVSTEKIKL